MPDKKTDQPAPTVKPGEIVYSEGGSVTIGAPIATAESKAPTPQ